MTPEIHNIKEDHILSNDTLVRIENLVKKFTLTSGFFSSQKHYVHAVAGVNLNIVKGETLGLVGESGCGKTTLGRLILKLEPPTSGKVFFDDKDISNLNKLEMKSLRRKMQVIFQDPYSSLNPRKNIESIISEPLIIHGIGSRSARKPPALDLVNEVGLRPEHLSRYPHEFSGGQRQRIGIARALAVNPSLIIADEPVSALDVSVRSQALNLLEDLQQKHNLTYLFISHDLSVVRHISDRVAVMYLGKIVEIGNNEDIYSNPTHPYTEALLSAVPIPDPTVNRERIVLEGDVPSPMNPPTGCGFHPRCRLMAQICRENEPKLKRTIHEGHYAACFVKAP